MNPEGKKGWPGILHGGLSGDLPRLGALEGADHWAGVEMYQVYPQLCLCQNHWKADKIASKVYSQWNKHRKADPKSTPTVPLKREVDIDCNVPTTSKKIKATAL
jgi:hypothetical protein